MDLPPIWVISLERAPERRASVTRAFADLGVPITIFDAVDGLALDDDTRKQYSRWRSLFEVGRDLTLGEVGCALSHVRIYERMVAESIPELVVVEDDVQPTPGLFDVLRARDALPAGWDVVTLHSLFPSAHPRPLEGPALAGEYRVCTFERIPFGTQCYLIDLDAARRVLEVAYPVRMPLDELLYRGRPAGLRVLGIEPSPVIHADFASELHTRRASDAHGLTRLAEQTVVTCGKAWARATKPSRPLA